MSAFNIRVLVADDSPTARALLVGMLSASSGIDVVGQAKNGLEAVEMTARLKPDLVTMDIEMPGLNGYEATRRIMSECPTPIVIVSSLDVRSVEISMEALQAGALEVIPKPVGPTAPGHAAQARYLAATVRAMSDVRLVRRWPNAAVPYKEPPALPVTQRAKVIAIAASTGGPVALHKLLGGLSKEFPVPILIVQHMATGFGDGFATWLDSTVPMPVKVARLGEPVLPGVAYLAPDSRHLGVSDRSTIVLSDTPSVGGFRPSASFLFESAGRVYGAGAVGVILTGMGSDGLEGMRSLKAAGGYVIAQDEATCEIFGMPGVVVAAGIADRVLPLPRIGEHLVARTAKAS
ncbi:MAG: chemotaxis response regulator protein-glutamate methylesterase [Pseudomonadota bacterium]|nr:chemotaxis response regulator protein-glutamate methylesterase [Pseudomonadota bacterium]